jgi:hypothetical protein
MNPEILDLGVSAGPTASGASLPPLATRANSSRASGRRVSPSEARRIALNILYRAESRREQTAREEAARGIKWEDVE